jgi:hypothetical protein
LPPRTARDIVRRVRTIVGALVLVGAVAHAAVGPRPLPPPPAGWHAVTFPRVARHTEYAATPDGALRAHAACAASALAVDARTVDLGATPRLAWRWRVVRSLPPHDERVRAGDDFAARVYVTFPLDPAHATLVQRLRHRLGVALWGDDLPGSSLTWVWSSRAPAGAAWPSPYASEAWVVVLGSGAMDGWREEVVDVAAEYRHRFGVAPPPLQAVAVMTDADDACADAEALYAGFRFLPAAAGAP